MRRPWYVLLLLLFLLAGCAQSGRPRAIEAVDPGAPGRIAPGAPSLADKDGDRVADNRDECPGTPPNTRVDAFGCPVPLYLHLILPCNDDAALTNPTFLSRLDAVAVLLRDNPEARASVEVHSAESDGAGRGDPTQRRAETIRALLAKRLADGAARVEAKGLGSARPMVSNASEAGRQRNRRVEIIVTGVYKDTPKPEARSSGTAPLPGLALQAIHFPRAEASTDADGDETLYRLARLLRAFPAARVTLAGHADSRGHPVTNQTLSEQRAAWVKTRLVEDFGISPERLQSVGYGHRQPVADNDTQEGREANRRVAIAIDGLESPAPAQYARNARPAGPPPSARAAELTEVPVTSPHPTASRAPEEVTQLPVVVAAERTAAPEADIADIRPADVVYERIPPKATKKRAEEVQPATTHARLSPDRTYAIEVSVSRCRLWLYELLPGGARKLVNTYVVATAKPGTAYPEGTGYVTKVDLNPSWIPTPNMLKEAHRKGRRLPRYVPPGSRANPMGEFKIHLSHGSAFRIHGTNKPRQIGQRVSRGCIRMHNGEGEQMAKAIAVGTEVHVRY